MKKFNRQILTFTFLLLVIFVSAILINNIAFNNSKYFTLPKNINTAILGHSHPECAYNDSLILNFKNLAQSGEAYFYTYLKVKKLISENNQIKTILIEFESTQIDTLMDSWTWGDMHISARFTNYFPLIGYSGFYFIWQKNSSAILQYFPKSFMKSFGNNLIDNLKKKNILTDHRYGGYQYITRAKVDSLLIAIENMNEISRDNFNSPISITNIKYLTKTIELCNQKGLQVLLIRSPLHKKYGNTIIEKKFQHIRNTYYSKIEFLDFRNFPLENDEFGDFGHLNYKGAQKYSIFFDHLLKNNLLKKENKQAFIDSIISKPNVSKNILNK